MIIQDFLIFQLNSQRGRLLLNIEDLGTPLVVQWLRLPAPNARCPVRSLSREPSPTCPQLRMCALQLNIPHAATQEKLRTPHAKTTDPGQTKTLKNTQALTLSAHKDRPLTLKRSNKPGTN